MKTKKILIFCQVVVLLLLVFSFFDFNLKAASSIGLGDVDYTEKRDIYDGVSLEYAVGYNNNEEQKAYTVEMKKGSLIPYSTYGEYIYGGEILSKMIKEGENEFNKKVVVAINGDFYDTSNGVARGIMIVNGKLVTLGYAVGSEEALGFKDDGSVIFAKPDFTISFKNGENSYDIKYLNNDRKYNKEDLFLYTSDFGSSTKSYADGKEIILSTDDETFKIGSTIKAKVESIGVKDSALNPGQIILASGNQSDSRLSGLTIGQEITITVNDNNPSSGWSEVVQSIGYPHLLAKDGKPTGAIEDPAVHPRTALGVKKDGTVVLFQVDGRQPGWSNGVTFKQMVEWLVDVKGCDTVVNLDGGGSSTIMARLPGNSDAEVLNSPSDGGERSNSNAILFFAPDDADPNREIAHLHSYPKNLCILEGAETNIKVLATDKYYYPVATPTDLKYESDNEAIKVENGKLTCGKTSTKGTITITSNNIKETMDVTVIDNITKIAVDKTIISVAPNGKTEIKVTAYNGSMPLTTSNSSFTWDVSPKTIGSVSNGIFTGSSTGGTGTLTISFKKYKTSIPVEVGKLPNMIQTFENITIGKEWISTIENKGNGGDGKVSINTDERYVKFGKKSLRIDYDFRSATATTGVTAYQSGGYYKLEGYPTNIGMWVYGDGNGANVRIQIRDGKGAVQYISFEPSVVDWVGWKYIETSIPTGLPTPIQIQYPIRVMSVGGKVKTNGTLYFDNIRAVYGFKNDDLKEPTFSEITPVDGSFTDNNQERISVNLKDEPDENNNYTGINKDSIKMWLNDEEITNLVLVDNSDGSITCNYTPSALSLLKPGPQNIKMRVEDNYGNFTIKNWQFTLNGEYAGVIGEKPTESTIYAGDTVYYYVKTKSYKNFEKVTGKMSFNNKALMLTGVSVEDKNIKADVTKTTDANSKGVFEFTLSGMNQYEITESGNLIRLAFKVKNGFTSGSDSNIVFSDVYVYEKGYNKPTKFILPSYEVKVDYKYRISFVTSTVGSSIKFKVTDDKLNPVEGVSFETTASISSKINVTTDKDGYAIIDNFKELKENTTFTIKATKGKYYSEDVTVKIQPSLGSNIPSSIFVSPGTNATNSVYLTWKTNLTTTKTVVNYRIKGTETWETVENKNGIERVYVKTGSMHQEYLAHMILLSNLKENTEYEYYVGDGTNNSKTYAFKTLPTKEVEIVFLGDPQNTNETGYQITKKTLDAAFKRVPNANLLMYAGDIVDDVTINSQWEAFHKVLEGYNTSVITAAATGNHDVITSYSRPFITSLTPLQNGIETIGASYSFEIGNACICVIDTESASLFDEEAEWLKSVMSKTDKDFKIVLMHRSPYASNYDEPYIRDYWPSVFEEAKVDLVLSGHDHVYASTTMLGKEKTTTDKGVTYVVGGACGQKYYNANNISSRYWLDVVYDEDVPVYTTIKIKDGALKLESYALKGTEEVLINTITINAKKEDVKEIELDLDGYLATTQNSIVLKGKAIGTNNEVLSENINFEIKNEVKGVTIKNNTLTVTSELEHKTQVTIIASYRGVTKEFTIDVKLLDSTIVSKSINEITKSYLDIFIK